MNKYKKVLIGVLAFIILIVLLNFGLNFWITYRLPAIINENNESPYVINYRNAEVSLLDSNIKASDVVIVPKRAIGNQVIKAGIYGKVRTIEVIDYKLWSVLFSDKIKAKTIRITKPELTLYKKDEKSGGNSRSFKSDAVASFDKIISVTDIYVYNGAVKIIAAQNNKPVMSVDNLNLNIDGVLVDEATLQRKIPFRFNKYTFSCDSLYYKPGPYYFIKTDRITASNTACSVQRFKMVPELTRKQFVAAIPKEKDLFTIFVKAIEIKKLNWGFNSEVLFANAGSVSVDELKADIYRSLVPADDQSERKLYSRMLRELDFNLQIDTVRIKNGFIVYEEEKSFDRGSGKIAFDRFNATVTNVASGFRQKKLPDVRIAVSARFMNTSPLKVNWSFNVLNKSDAFRIRGSILNYNVAGMEPFTKPYMNLTTKGILNEVHFDFKGDHTITNGNFGIRYDDLKVTVFRKNDRTKKNRLLTAVGNLVIKNDSKGRVKNTAVHQERNSKRSFFNYLWLSLQNGLKQILLKV